MKNRKAAAICNALAMVCWGILVYGGIYDGKVINIILYGICFVFSAISLILNITAIKKETNNNPRRN